MENGVIKDTQFQPQQPKESWVVKLGKSARVTLEKIEFCLGLGGDSENSSQKDKHHTI